MGDQAENEGDQSIQIRETEARSKRSYSEDDRYVALAALDLNGGNVYRTAKALDIPVSTLDTWRMQRAERQAYSADHPRAKEARGDLAVKIESLAHSIAEAMPSKIGTATLSQCAVALGISVDKVRILRSIGLDPDPAAELCRLLGINRAQLPPDLTLKPGEELPDGFSDFIDMQPSPDGSFEPVPTLAPRYHHPDIGTVLTSQDQDNLPLGYVRVLASINGAQPEYTLKLSELQPVTLASEDPDDNQMLSSIPDDDNEN